jgi:hypothetical protein
MEIIDSIYSLQILDVQPVLQGYVRCLSIPRLIYREGAEPRDHFEVSSETVDTTLGVVSICTTRRLLYTARTAYSILYNMQPPIYPRLLYPRSSGLQSWGFLKLSKAKTGRVSK